MEPTRSQMQDMYFRSGVLQITINLLWQIIIPGRNTLVSFIESLVLLQLWTLIGGGCSRIDSFDNLDPNFVPKARLTETWQLCYDLF